MRIYRILRNNKEQGPYSLDELVQLSLKPNDLIWIDGRSAGWRYPTEIEALKPYLAGQEPNLNKEAPTPSASTGHPASQNTRMVQDTVNSQPVPAKTNTGGSPENPTEVEELTEEKLQRKADEIYQRIQAYNLQNQQALENVQTKYARSLEDLKQEYADWLHRKKDHKRFISNKRSVIAIGFLACIAIIFFFFTNRSRLTLTAAKQTSTPIIKEPVALNKHINTDAPRKIISKVQKSENSPAESKTLQKDQSVDEYIDSIEHILAKQNFYTRLTLPSKYTAKGKESTQKTVAEPANDAIQRPERIEAQLSQLVNLSAKYMHDDGKSSISGLEVTIQNNSAELLKLVTVDVYYYKKKEKLFDKETLYFSNIPPGNSFTLSTPGNKKAVSARFQLGQVSSSTN
jgi:hypothetical protein